jgi:predicted kinase
MESRSLIIGSVIAVLVPVSVAAVCALIRRHTHIKRSTTPSYSTLRRNSHSHADFTVIEEKASNAKLIPHTQVMGTWTSLGLEQPLVIAMVGLPARGKSYIVKMLVRYLKWNGYDAEVFNVGSYRRQRGLASADASFFNASNEDAQKLREQLAMHVLDSLYQWLHEPVENSKGRVGIFDATNTTRARRLALAERARRENVFLLFVESICDDEAVLQRNYALKLKNDDYKKVDTKTAMKDFIARVQAYEKVYETIQDDEDNNQVSYIKLINVGQKVITRNCTGYVPSQVAFYLQNIHILPRKIYLSLNSEVLNSDSVGMLSSNVLSGPAGVQNSRLSEAGLAYSLDLAKYIYSRQETVTDLSKAVFVLAGTTSVHAETILHLRNLFPCFATTLLNDLRVGELKDDWQVRSSLTVW